MNFIFNFGVTIDSKKIFEKSINESETYEEFESKVQEIPLMQVLIIYKYLAFAEKKIHNIMYAERVDEIDTDLLSDF